MIDKKDKENEYQLMGTFVNLKSVFIAIISIFLAGVGSVVAVTKYLDERATDRFFEKTNGQVLEQRVRVMEENYKEQSGKMEVLQQQQNQLLIGIGEIKGRIDLVIQPNKR